jgi:hypothetical protein
MGWIGESWQLSASLDAHAGEKEHQDEKLWKQLRQELVAVAKQPKYESLILEYPGRWGDDEDDNEPQLTTMQRAHRVLEQLEPGEIVQVTHDIVVARYDSPEESEELEGDSE